MADRMRMFGYTFLCLLIVFTPVLTFVFAGMYVGAPVIGHEAEYWAAVPAALPMALGIALLIAVLGGCCAFAGLHDLLP